MSGVNSSIPLQFQPTQNIGPDFGAAIQNAQQLMQFQAYQKQTEQQNKLRDILGAKDAIDQKTGIPTPETFSKVMSVDPMTGMKLQQNSLAMQQRNLQISALRSKTSYDQSQRMNEAYAPILEQFTENIGGGKMSPQQAMALAQSQVDKVTSGFESSGDLPPETVKQLPRKFDPDQFRVMAAQTSQYHQWWQEQDAKQRLDIQQKQFDRQTAADKNRGAGIEKDVDGRQFVYRPDAEGAQQAVYLGTKETVPQEKMVGATKVGTGAGSAATQDAARVANVARFDYEKELGHPVQTPEEKAELDRRTMAAVNQQAADRAAGVAKAKQQITENSGVTQDPDEKAANAAQIAAGQPTTQVVAGWGKEAAAARKQAHADAIKLIMDQTGMNAVDAGVELANRGIDYAGGRRAVGQESVMLAATRQSVKQLDYNIGQVKKELAGMPPDVNLGPLITGIIRQEQTWTGDPRLGPLYYSMSAVANESARLQSGGQASVAQLHTAAAKEAERWANSNMNSATFGPVAGTMLDEGQARIKSFEDAIKESRVGGQPTSGNTAPSVGGGTVSGQQHPPPNPANIRWLKKNPDKAAEWDRSYPDYPSSQYLGGAATSPPAQAPAQSTSPAPSPTPQAGPRATQSTTPTTEGAGPSQKFVEGKTYVDGNGNRAVYKNGKFEPVQ